MITSVLARTALAAGRHRPGMIHAARIVLHGCGVYSRNSHGVSVRRHHDGHADHRKPRHCRQHAHNAPATRYQLVGRPSHATILTYSYRWCCPVHRLPNRFCVLSSSLARLLNWPPIAKAFFVAGRAAMASHQASRFGSSAILTLCLLLATTHG